MHVEKLKLRCFRNYPQLELCPGVGLNVLTGSNAEGKTNAVEAVFLCAFFRSHRTAKDTELIKHGESGAYVGMSVKSDVATRRIEIKLREGERKKLLIDSHPAERTGELMGILNVVMFAPEDLMIVKGAPAERRRFIDMEISQSRPAYYYSLQQYNSALKQKNALLKDVSRYDAKGLHTQLELWNERLSASGASIMAARREFVEMLSPVAAEIHSGIAGSDERLCIAYSPNVTFEKGCDEVGLKTAFERACKAAEEDDIRRGFATVGVHRDDLSISLSGLEARVYGSQGQQRTAALSLKLSELRILRKLTGETPVLILDDVLSELDESRQEMLLSSINDCQCFLTCTSLDNVLCAQVDDMRVYECRAGELFEEE